MFKGGPAEAKRRFEQFLKNRLDGFADNRNNPGGDGGSDMSPYLHFGQVSPVTLALLAQEHGGNGTPAFLEELIMRRELSVNFVRYNDHYDSFDRKRWHCTRLISGNTGIHSMNSSVLQPMIRTGMLPSRK